MPDSSQNGHSSKPQPLLRPPVGDRAGRGLSSDEPPRIEAASVLEAEASHDNGNTVEMESIEVAPYDAHMVENTQPPLLDERLDEEREDEAALANFDSDGSGGEPPYGGHSNDNGGSSGWSDPNTPNDKEMGLIEHLGELRTRIMYCVAAVGLAMILTWNKCTEISAWFAKPIQEAIKGHGNIISTDPTAFFTMYLQISMVSALLLTMPFLLLQVWRFIEPALTNKERKYTLVLVPFSSLLFFLGAGMGYLLAPMFFKFFLEFQPEGVLANWDYLQCVLLLAKTLLVFGLAFQVPVVIIFLNKAGIVSRNLLIEYWRHAVVVIFTIIAIVTPTWDPITMTACAIPPCLLYLLSIWLVKWL